jgi:hypothetical protein
MAAPLNTCTTIEQGGVVRFFVGKKYGCSKGYRQRNAAHTGSISLSTSFAASIFFAHKKRTTPRCSIVVHAFKGAAIL